MSGDTFYGLREMVLPGPSQTTGYRTILVIGTTGAGKSTLIRQLMGTSGPEAFPATSASKTTVAETELLLAPGDYYAVATFMPLVEVRAYVEENVVAAALAIFDDRPGAEVRSRLLGPRWYRIAADLTPLPPVRALLSDAADGFDVARRFLNMLTDRYLFPLRDGWFGSAAS